MGVSPTSTNENEAGMPPMASVSMWPDINQVHVCPMMYRASPEGVAVVKLCRRHKRLSKPGV